MAKQKRAPPGSKLPDFMERQVAATIAVVKHHGAIIEGNMRQNAAWTDRTSLARQGLYASTALEKRPASTVVWLQAGHSMEYGLYLETVKGRFHGQRRLMTASRLSEKDAAEVTAGQWAPYAIVWPSVDQEWPNLNNSLQQLWGV
jgi:hypothetical protein